MKTPDLSGRSKWEYVSYVRIGYIKFSGGGSWNYIIFQSGVQSALCMVSEAAETYVGV